MKITRRLRNQWIAAAGLIYLGGAVAYRVASRLDVTWPVLSPLYHTLPGGLAGGVLYAAWTGLRGRRQSLMSLALSAAAGVVVAAVALPALWSAMAPAAAGPGVSSVPPAWDLVCDLSAITTLFALFMSISLPLTRRRPARETAGRREA